MKKALVILVALAFVAPLYASSIDFVETSPGVIEWTSDVAVVAMGLDVEVTGGPDQIGAVVVDEGTSFFDIYMDAAHDMEDDTPGSYSYGAGSPIADQVVAGEIGLPSSIFCISMGGLGGESEPLDSPPTSGKIVLTADGTGIATGTIDENVLRGGVIDEVGDTMTTNLPITFDTTPEGDCMVDAGIDISDPVRYAAFVEAGKPDCWCKTRQCHGNAGGILEGSSKGGYYYVGVTDLNVLMTGWEIKEAPFGTGIAGVIEPVSLIEAACANFDNDAVVDPLVPLSGTFPGGIEGSSKGGYYHVGTGDLNILMVYWEVLEPAFGVGVPADCLPGTL